MHIIYITTNKVIISVKNVQENIRNKVRLFRENVLEESVLMCDVLLNTMALKIDRYIYWSMYLSCIVCCKCYSPNCSQVSFRRYIVVCNG